MIQNIILVNGGTFCPGLPFLDHFDKGTPSRFLAKMFIFVLVPRNLILIMSKVQWKIIFDQSSQRLMAAILNFSKTVKNHLHTSIWWGM